LAVLTARRKIENKYRRFKYIRVTTAKSTDATDGNAAVTLRAAPLSRRRNSAAASFNNLV